MTIEEARKIEAIWNALETNEPDISTCRLFAMTVDIAQTEGLPVEDDSDVADALCMVSDEEDQP